MRNANFCNIRTPAFGYWQYSNIGGVRNGPSTEKQHVFHPIYDTKIRVACYDNGDCSWVQRSPPYREWGKAKASQGWPIILESNTPKKVKRYSISAELARRLQL
jgi:hypothetical protein